MFSAWNFSEWILSIAATVWALGLLVALSTLLGYISIQVLGKEIPMPAELELPEAKTETEPPLRTAA